MACGTGTHVNVSVQTFTICLFIQKSPIGTHTCNSAHNSHIHQHARLFAPHTMRSYHVRADLKYIWTNTRTKSGVSKHSDALLLLCVKSTEHSNGVCEKLPANRTANLAMCVCIQSHTRSYVGWVIESSTVLLNIKREQQQQRLTIWMKILKKRSKNHKKFV